MPGFLEQAGLAGATASYAGDTAVAQQTRAETGIVRGSGAGRSSGAATGPLGAEVSLKRVLRHARRPIMKAAARRTAYLTAARAMRRDVLTAGPTLRTRRFSVPHAASPHACVSAPHELVDIVPRRCGHEATFLFGVLVSLRGAAALRRTP
jgi:hypothetical protein